MDQQPLCFQTHAVKDSIETSIMHAVVQLPRITFIVRFDVLSYLSIPTCRLVNDDPLVMKNDGTRDHGFYHRMKVHFQSEGA